MFRAASLDAVVRAGLHHAGFEEVHVAAGGEIVAFEVEDGVGDELAGAVEGGLAAAEGFVEGGLPEGRWGGEVGELLRGDGADFSPAAGVDGVEFGGDDCGIGRWGGGVGFVREEFGDQLVLEMRGVCVVCESWEVEVA